MIIAYSFNNRYISIGYNTCTFKRISATDLDAYPNFSGNFRHLDDHGYFDNSRFSHNNFMISPLFCPQPISMGMPRSKE